VVTPPADLRDKLVEFIAKLGDIEADPVLSARVVINERTGTIVAGGDVRLSPVAIAQGGISIIVRETKTISQPNALSTGQTREVQNSEVEAQEKAPAPSMTYLSGGATLADVAQALAALGVSPRELASLLQGLKGAGALRAEIVMQ
jgi:flagellar P-ring protein precursor FlgI